MNRVENGKSVSVYEELFPNYERDEADEEENGESTEVAEDEESEDGSHIIEEEIKTPSQEKEDEFSREKGMAKVGNLVLFNIS